VVPGRISSAILKISLAAGLHPAKDWPMPEYWAPWPENTNAIILIYPLATSEKLVLSPKDLREQRCSVEQKPPPNICMENAGTLHFLSVSN
jgi:hypothetical protein